MSNTRSNAAIALALLTALLALVLRWETARHEITGQASSCRVSETLDCDAVQASAYAKLLGVSLSTWGAAGSLILAGWLVAARRGHDSLLAAAGGLVAFNLLAALYTASVAWFDLGKLCLYCTGMHVAILGTAVLVLPPALRARRRGLRREPVALAGCLAALILGLALAGEAYASHRSELLGLHARQDGDALRIDVSGALRLGAPDAWISVIIYFDFGCPVCAYCYRKASALHEKYPRDIQFIFKNYPLDRECNKTLDASAHANACRAARASLVADAMGHGPESLRYLFDKRNVGFSWPNLEGLAKTLGLADPELRARMKTPDVERLLARDVGEGNALKLDQVPAIWVNGRSVAASRLEQRVERLLGR